nr:site-specific integrase [Deinococcus irradiatisoli]
MVVLLQAHHKEEERWFGARADESPVFTRSSGERLDPSNLAWLFHRLVREAGLPRIRFHGLRHTAASLPIRQGVPPKVVSDRLGHADVAFTLSVYTYLYEISAGQLPFHSASCCRRSPQRPSPQVSETDWWLNCSS